MTWIGAWGFSHYYGLRLPTREEWLKAARGTNDWGYSYGPEGALNRGNTGNSGDPWDPVVTGSTGYTNETTPVGFYNGQNYQGYQTIDSPSPYGTYDQDGNVREFTYSWQTQSSHNDGIFTLGSHYSSSANWATDHYGLLIWQSWYNFEDHNYAGANMGFRCARTISNSQ